MPRDAFSYCRYIFRRLCRLDIVLGRSSRCGNTSPRGGNRAGVVFAGLRTSECSTGCMRASGASASARTGTPSDADSLANFRYELVTRAPVGSEFRPKFARNGGTIVSPRTTSSAALVRALEEPHETLLLAVWLHAVNTVFASFDTPLSWGELLKRTAKETSDDDCLGLAAQLAVPLLPCTLSRDPLSHCSRELLSPDEFQRRPRTDASTNCSCRCADVFGRPTEAYFGH